MDIGSIASLTSSLKAAGDITKALIDLRDGQAIQGKIIELQREILAAQSGALSAQSAQFELVNRVRDLEEEIARTKCFGAERKKYVLRDVGTGSFAYVSKPDTNATEPPHWLCTKCFGNHQKSILQYSGRTNGNADSIYSCPTCRSKIQTPWSITPETLAAQTNTVRLAPVRCPYCRGEATMISERPHPELGPAGVKEHDLSCIRCKKPFTRMFTEDNGYS